MISDNPHRNMSVWAARSGTIRKRVHGIQAAIRSCQAGPLTRQAFTSRIEGCLTGPFADWIRLNLAKRNPSVPRDARAWEELAGQVEYEFPAWILHPIKGKFDRRNAVFKAIDRLRREERHNHRSALFILAQGHKLTRTRPLPKKAIEGFFDWVADVLDQCLAEREG